MQALPLLQAVPLAMGGCWQAALAPLQLSPVQALPSSAHAVPGDLSASAGHAADVPVQVSATSHAPAAVRQVVVAAANPSAGHAADVPGHFSATSHVPADARQVVVAGANASAGHASAVPLHTSAVSHVPVDARHVVPLVTGEQVPTLPESVHEPQPPLQALSQQTPPTQKPLAHWPFAVHVNANDGS